VSASAFPRLLRILRELQANPGGLAIRDLAARLGLTVKTVNNDLEMMHFYDLPVDTDDWERPNAPGTFWRFLPGSYVPTLSLNVAEVAALLSSLECRHEPVARRIAGQLAKLLSRQRSETMLRHRRRILLKGIRSMYPDAEVEEKIKTLQDAAERGRVVALWYYSRQEQREERLNVNPLGVVFESTRGVWFLVADERPEGRRRFFNMLRVKQASILPTTFAYPEDFDLRGYLRAAWGIEVAAEPVRVKVRFCPHFDVQAKVRKAVREGRPDARLTEEPDGALLFEDVISGTEEFRRWLRGFGRSAEVLKPAALREEMLRSAYRLLRLYEPGACEEVIPAQPAAEDATRDAG
jgi:predicted DNA-binding transcriptional regulator YafY